MTSKSIELEPRWWSSITLDDAPKRWLNPHMRSVWEQSTPHKQDIGLMVISIFVEVNPRIRRAKYEYVKREFEAHDIYVDIDIDKALAPMFGSISEAQKLVAAMMEVYTPTGLYSKDRVI